MSLLLFYLSPSISLLSLSLSLSHSHTHTISADTSGYFSHLFSLTLSLFLALLCFSLVRGLVCINKVAVGNTFCFDQNLFRSNFCSSRRLRSRRCRCWRHRRPCRRRRWSCRSYRWWIRQRSWNKPISFNISSSWRETRFFLSELKGQWNETRELQECERIFFVI